MTNNYFSSIFRMISSPHEGLTTPHTFFSYIIQYIKIIISPPTYGERLKSSHHFFLNGGVL